MLTICLVVRSGPMSIFLIIILIVIVIVSVVLVVVVVVGFGSIRFDSVRFA